MINVIIVGVSSRLLAEQIQQALIGYPDMDRVGICVVVEEPRPSPEELIAQLTRDKSYILSDILQDEPSETDELTLICNPEIRVTKTEKIPLPIKAPET